MGPFDAALLASAIGLTVPILLAASGETLAERAGVLNVGLEGMILGGAFASFLVVWETGSLVAGLVAGVAGGALFAALMALVTVDLKGDQIVDKYRGGVDRAPDGRPAQEPEGDRIERDQVEEGERNPDERPVEDRLEQRRDLEDRRAVVEHEGDAAEHRESPRA